MVVEYLDGTVIPVDVIEFPTPEPWEFVYWVLPSNCCETIIWDRFYESTPPWWMTINSWATAPVWPTLPDASGRPRGGHSSD